MILLVHLMFGAAVGSLLAKYPLLAIMLAFLGHYFLDLFPHVEYNIESASEKQWRKKLPAFFKVALDFFLGILLIFLFSKNYPIIYICAFFGVLPDGLSILNIILPNKILNKHDFFHFKKVHFLKDKKISILWRIPSQVVAITISLILLIKT